MPNKLGSSTRSVHLACRPDAQTGAIVPPEAANSAFAYDDLSQWRAVALKEQAGYIYSRNTNPTTDLFETRVAALEGTEGGLSFSTGMAAISTTLFALLSTNSRVVTVRDAYGATYLHFSQILPRFGIRCTICDTEDESAIEAAIGQGLDLLYLETPTNPTLKIVDIARWTAAAHQQGAVVVVDNTFATPINQQPAALGVDVVIHSATKYLCGHGDVLGGVACGKKSIIRQIFRHRELTGASLDAHSAAMLLRSLKTLGLRVERQNQNALGLARFLEEQPEVQQVYYPGLTHHPGHAVARQQMSGFGGVLSFELDGGMAAVEQFLPQLRYAYLAANLGQVETVVGPPSTTSHVELTDEERKAAGITEGLIRYAVGIEDLEDLKHDIRSALDTL